MSDEKRIPAELGERSEPREAASVVKRRRDNKRRVLRMGEQQMPDGRYKYFYQDMFGERKAVYSWRLDVHDPYPKNKKRDLSLREKEQQIQAALRDKVAVNGGGYNVLELAEKYVSLRKGMRHNTEVGYRYTLNVLRKEEFGRMRIDQVKPSDAKRFLIELQQKGKKRSTVQTIRGVLRPAFRMALADDLIHRNPFDFELVGVLVNDSVMREAISKKDMWTFLNFIKEDPHYRIYYEGMYILFFTGLRISEFTGLTISDLDMENRVINVDHQLLRTRNMRYQIERPKTASGIRKVPMRGEVHECFQTILANRKAPVKEPDVDGYSGFLYLDKNGKPVVAQHWEKHFQLAREKYNSIYKKELPLITPHVCRHTFCSNMARAGISPKALQYIMGHSDISVTLNTYTHLGFEDAKKEMLEVPEI